MLTCIDVKFIFDSVRVRLSSSTNILQISRRVVFLLFLPCFWLLFRLVSAVVLTLEMSQMSAFFFDNQNNSTLSPGLLGNSALTCTGLHFWRHFLVKHEINSSKFGHQWLVMVNYVWAFSQSELGKYFEWIIILLNDCIFMQLFMYLC